MAFAVLPDMLDALVTFLDNHANLAPLHGGRVATKLASDSASVRITSLGGPQPWPWQASPQYAIEWWGNRADPDEGVALTLCRTGEAALWELANSSVSGVRIAEFSMPLSQLWSPDEETARPRFRTDVALTIYPA
jgi:hypothetical protein